jgi:hypothetical protein
VGAGLAQADGGRRAGGGGGLVILDRLTVIIVGALIMSLRVTASSVDCEALKPDEGPARGGGRGWY